jgi:hypothetical protein
MSQYSKGVPPAAMGAMPNSGREKPSRSHAARSHVDPEVSSWMRALPGENTACSGLNNCWHASTTSFLVRKMFPLKGFSLDGGTQEESNSIVLSEVQLVENIFEWKKPRQVTVPILTSYNLILYNQSHFYYAFCWSFITASEPYPDIRAPGG